MTSDDARPTVGICLSGGGFRAALYGLGVLRYLAESGTLERVAVVCGVSGGSVATAALGSAVRSTGTDALSSDGFYRYVYEPFVAGVTGNNLRQRALQRWLRQRLGTDGRPRNLVLADVLAETLFPAAGRLAELPERPQLIFTGTELGAGRAFRFSREFIGSWDFGYAVTSAEMKVATAVAASAAAPPLIPALQLETSGLGLKQAPPVLTITDGGVYDNLGIEWFQGWNSQRRPAAAVAAEDLIVVNASGPLGHEEGRLAGLAALNRSRKVQYAQTQATRVRWLVAEMEAGRQRGLYFGISGDPRCYRLPVGETISPACYAGALPSRLVSPLAGLRTDFDRFSDDEAGLLAYHGYWSAHARFASLRPEEAVPKPAWRIYEGMTDTEAAAVERELRRPRHRLGIGERLR